MNFLNSKNSLSFLLWTGVPNRILINKWVTISVSNIFSLTQWFFLKFVLKVLIVIVTTVNPHLFLFRRRGGGTAFHKEMVEPWLYCECSCLVQPLQRLQPQKTINTALAELHYSFVARARSFFSAALPLNGISLRCFETTFSGENIFLKPNYIKESSSRNTFRISVWTIPSSCLLNQRYLFT